jgi:large subunit ribosomal protein L28
LLIRAKVRYLQTQFKKRLYYYDNYIMAKVCDITGKRPRVGNNVSHANNKTKRMFYPNLHKKNFYIPEEDAWITLKVCSKALRTINKNGISAVLKDAQAKGMVIIK